MSISEREQFLSEIYIVLRRNGYLVLTTPNKDSVIAKFDKIVGRFIVEGWWNGHDYGHKHVYGFNEIKRIIERTGFKIIKAETFYLFYGFPILTKTSLGMCTWLLAQKITK